jgi:hypothetical protein
MTLHQWVSELSLVKSTGVVVVLRLRSRRDNFADLDVLCGKVSTLHHRAQLQDSGGLPGEERPFGPPGSAFLLSAGPPWCV